MKFEFSKELYSKEALIKAAYNYTDRAYVHLDVDDEKYYVSLEMKDGNDEPDEKEFVNEMLAQSVRHLIYKQTKGIRELLLARAMATSVITDTDNDEGNDEVDFSEDEILKDWFDNND
ncbi:MAG: His-Xaa-Ser system protein HxsD [Butyrivibrio sp.]|nr:His-Xaa-Ser system protein HxsD [Butyrivibrio sp.]